jgi:hypothetical protein
MEFLVNMETQTLQVGARHQRIFDRFWEQNLFPLVRIVRVVEDDDEIIAISTATAEKTEDDTYDLIVRHVEIIKKNRFERLALPTGWLN